MNENEHEDIVIEPEHESNTNIKRKSDEKLRAELKQSQTDKEEYLLGWQRAKADLINFKREVEDNRVRLARHATEDLVVRLLPVLDNFRIALSHTKNVENNWLKGMEYVYMQLHSILKAEGLEEIDPVGEAFDPKIHESIGSEPVEREELNNTIVSTFQVGYKLHEKLIRPARVRVGEFNKN